MNTWRGVELDPQGAVEPFDLARRGRGPRLGQQMLDAVLPADPVEQHLHRRVAEPAGEHLAVIGQDLLAAPHEPAIAALSPSQTGWVRSRGISRADMQNREWSSTPVNAFARRAVREQEPADDVHLPQLHRPAPLPPLPPRHRGDAGGPGRSPRPGPGTDTPPTPTAAGTTSGPCQLQRDPPRHPSTDAARRISNTLASTSAGI